MSTNVPISQSNITAPTPQNTPLAHAPISSGLSRPTVPDIAEDNEPAEEEQSSAIQSAMLGMVQGRLHTLVGQSSGYVENLPVKTKRNVEALIGVQVKQNELQNQYKRECLELEKKYLSLAMPLYQRRHAIISGASEPTSEEIEAGEKQSVKDDEDYTPLPKEDPEDEKAEPGVPNFWLTVLMGHPGLMETISERDGDALKSLTDITIEYLPTEGPESKPGFKLVFSFAENEFFENKKLEKTYIYQEEVGYSGDFVYDRAIGTEIKWKAGKDLTKEFEIKKQRNKNTNRTRLIRKAIPTESFFNFFTPPVPPSPEAVESGDLEDEELDEIDAKLELDYQIGEDFKEKIIPRAIDYFTGKALEYEMDSEDEYEDLDEDEDGDAFEDSDEDEDIPPVPRKRLAAAGAGGDTKLEECKQQ